VEFEEYDVKIFGWMRLVLERLEKIAKNEVESVSGNVELVCRELGDGKEEIERGLNGVRNGQIRDYERYGASKLGEILTAGDVKGAGFSRLWKPS
jgi:hypothetical protein